MSEKVTTREAIASKKEGRKKALSLLVNFVYLYGNYYHFMSFLSFVNPTTTFLWLEVTFLFKADAKCFLAVIC